MAYRRMKKRAAALPGWMCVTGDVTESCGVKAGSGVNIRHLNHTLQFFMLHNLCFITTWL